MRIFLILCLLTINFFALGQNTLKQDLSYYLPKTNYNSKITTPEEHLGFQIGEWHVSHDQVVSYMKLLDAQSDRVEYHEYARTHEKRPLFTLYISDESNIKNKNVIKKNHFDLANKDIAQKIDISNLPLILYQGYSIHGNEASGVNAAMLVAYHLVAGESEEIKKLLKECFIIFDPCYNPDGVTRFSSWANSHKGHNLISDPISREYNEAWPGGRTNHYWFDLNRDWLLLTHPESQGRVKHFQEWKPNVLTDHHEMGSNSTFFFQPGVPSRTNPITPWKNQELTEEIGTYHAAALDSIGSLYYTKNGFDDFYYGKGSTYPDIHGGIGILFEQASSRGHYQETSNGILSFPFTIRNQVVTSLSTHKACLAMKNKILNYKKEFYSKLQEEIDQSKIGGYIVYDHDRVKLKQFIKLFQIHGIDFYFSSNPIKTNSKSFPKESIVIPVNQSQYKLVKTMFEKVTSFKDSIFYDVSAWTVPLAFDVMYDELTTDQVRSIGKNTQTKVSQSPSKAPDNSYAAIINWNQAFAPAFLQSMLNKGIICKATNQDLNIENQIYKPGTIIVPLHGQKFTYTEILKLIQELSALHEVDVYYVKNGNGTNEFTLGHPDVSNIQLPKIFSIIGQGVSSYDAGELWHYMDHRLQYPITLIDKKDLTRADLNKYNTLVLVEGNYNDINENNYKRLEDWIKKGGRVIALNSAIDFLRTKNVIKLNLFESKVESKTTYTYNQFEDLNGAKVIGGSIFNTNADLSHPLLYGVPDHEVAVFKQGRNIYTNPVNKFASPMVYSKKPLLSGYCPAGYSGNLAGSPAATMHSFGSGTITCFVDNLLFRGYWWGGFKIFANALFFAPIVNRETLEKEN